MAQRLEIWPPKPPPGVRRARSAPARGEALPIDRCERMLRAGADRAVIATTCHLDIVAVDMVASLTGVVRERLPGRRCIECESYIPHTQGKRCRKCVHRPAEVAEDRLQRMRVLIAARATQREIADELHLAPGTVAGWMRDARAITPTPTRVGA